MKGVLIVCMSLVLGYLGSVDLRWLNEEIVGSTTTAKVVQFYDLVGGVLMNDWYHYLFEERAMDVMIEGCGFETGQRVVEVGPGSGFLADKILRKVKEKNRNFDGSSAVETGKYFSYTGVDMSRTMHDISAQRLAPFLDDGVVNLHVVNDTFDFILSGLENGSVDRFIFTYVLDLLPPNVIRGFANTIPEKMNHLNNAKVCIVNLTFGFSPLSRIVTNVWQILYQILGGGYVGGCRPIHALDYFNILSETQGDSTTSPSGAITSKSGGVDEECSMKKDATGSALYQLEFMTKTVSTGLPSEVVIVSRQNV